jgi:hypothetical protein
MDSPTRQHDQNGAQSVEPNATSPNANSSSPHIQNGLSPGPNPARQPLSIVMEKHAANKIFVERFVL